MLLTTVLTVGLSTLALKFFFQAPLARASKDSAGNKVLVFGNGLKMFAAFTAIILPLAIAVLAYFFPPDPKDYAVVTIMTLLFFFGGGFCMIDSRTRVFFNHEGITKESPWHETRRMSWTEISAITYSEQRLEFTFERQRGPKIKVSALMTGIRNLAEEIEEKVPKETYATALKGMAFASNETDMFNIKIWYPFIRKKYKFADSERKKDQS